MQRRQLILSLSSLAAISAVKAKEAPKGKILIVYYSRKGENWWDGTTRVLQTGEHGEDGPRDPKDHRRRSLRNRNREAVPG